MTLPVSIGPNRCELVYNYEKQPLLKFSLRVCLPVRELLSVLSQLPPPLNHQPSKMQRPAKGPPDGAKRKASNAPQPTCRLPDNSLFLKTAAPLIGNPRATLGAEIRAEL